MKIAHVVDSMDVGGAEVLVSQMCRSQRAHGDEPIIYCIATLGALGEQLRKEGFSVHIHMGRNLLDGFRKLNRAFRESRPDVVHMHNPTPTIYGALAARMAGVRCVLTTRHSLVGKPRSLTVEVKYAAAAVFCNRVVGICDATVINLKSMHLISSRKLVRIYNGVAPVVRVDRSGEKAPNEFVLLCVGRLHPVKNHSLLLNAFATALAVNPRLRLWIVGDGGERKQLEQLAESLGLSSSVTFWGQQMDVAPLYSSADAFIMSSLSEGLPMALLQAFSVGLPCIVTDVGGMAEAVRIANAGMIVPLGDVECLAKAILNVAANPNAKEAFAQNAYEAFVDHFALEMMLRSYRILYGDQA